MCFFFNLLFFHLEFSQCARPSINNVVAETKTANFSSAADLALSFAIFFKMNEV